MSPGTLSWFFGRLFHHASNIAPFIPMNLHILASALFPIYTGAHASLSRPSSAAKPTKKQLRRRGETQESTTKMEGLSALDALLFPIAAGCVLGGLYLLLKWFEDPEILSKILNYYISTVGVFSITTFLADCTRTTASFLFPRSFYDAGFVWELNQSKCIFEPTPESSKVSATTTKSRSSPLPGVLSRLPLPSTLNHALWTFRNLLLKPVIAIKLKLGSESEGLFSLSMVSVLSFLVSLGCLLYFNLVSRTWWLYNLFGAALCYNAMQLMSPTTFWTGTLVLTALFFYDIYMVFFTPMMITVASKLDVPVKMLFPMPEIPGAEKKRDFSLLGLGDILIPGIMMGLALRFDLYAFYLKKQRRKQKPEDSRKLTPITPNATDGELPSTPLVYGKDGIGKAEYRPATGNWGDRFWLGLGGKTQAGSSFPKPYFYASIVGYSLGMMSTFAAIMIFDHGQPALLHLVPGVLLSLWGTALFRGELKTMWDYTELDEEAEQKEKKNENTKTRQGDQNKEELDEQEDDKGFNIIPVEDEPPGALSDGPKTTSKNIGKKTTENGSSFSFSIPRLFSVSISRPQTVDSDHRRDGFKVGDKVKSGLQLFSKGPVGASPELFSSEDSESSDEIDSPSSSEFVERGKKPDGEPGLKRRRIA